MYDDFIDLAKEVLPDSEEEGGERGSRIPLCPTMIVSFFSVPVRVLIDTGSQITALSEEFYKYMQLHGHFTELLVSSISIFTAIGMKATSIKKQIVYEVLIGNVKYLTCFLIIPNLSCPGIFGNDWFIKNKVIIDYLNCSIKINERLIPNSEVFFDMVTMDNLVSKKSSDFSYIQSNEIKSLENKISITSSGTNTINDVNSHSCLFAENLTID